MAYKEVEADPQETGKFVKLETVGQRFEGYYVSHAAGNHANTEDYTFRLPTGAETVFTANKACAGQLAKCGLKPGFKVLIVLSVLKPTGQTNPWKGYKVAYDSAPKVPMPAALAPPADESDPFAAEDGVPF